MNLKVYSAARAFFPLYGRSKEQAWKELTCMFNRHSPMPCKSYILQAHDLECIRRRQANDISTRDIFKCITSPDMYLEITECTPYESFAYDEKWMPMSGANIDEAHKNRMEFSLHSHPEATLVEIRRREKGDPSGLKNSKNSAQEAANVLGHILIEQIWPTLEVIRDKVTVKRDDSYRIDF